MARNPRIFASNTVYHTYCRVSRGELIFTDENESDHWVDTVESTAKIHGLTILAWCLMSNHYHLLFRSGTKPIWRAMMKIQRQTAVHYNLRHQVAGGLWQSRYKARLVLDENYYQQIIAYIHLNPVFAGIVDDPAEFHWSGHRELVGLDSRRNFLNVNEALRGFGVDLGNGRASYLEHLRNVAGANWIQNEVRELPWWISVPDNEQTINKDEAPANGVTFDNHLLEFPKPRKVPLSDLMKWFEHVGGLETGRLATRTQTINDNRWRTLFTLFAVDELGYTNREVAEAFRKSPSSISRYLSDGLRRKSIDASFKKVLQIFVERYFRQGMQQ